ncbi:GDP-mannose 4,6-dehydratase [Blastomonas sp.]|uniref:GDP-mannose 4,6-dehydratase n=1 Tax=Blastomonas sp. TaxID=1909299 RepID=UPI00263188A4|nr:GDP-mannose 4,6-dehydratase [Blastomonas sp.]MDM7957516.1 GDP-mannose 4,6-dehydratase [Blastomonas sp.]
MISEGGHDLPSRTAVIVGISGQDGGYLARKLLMHGYRVIGTSRSVEGGAFLSLDYFGLRNSVELCALDPCDPAAVHALIARFQPDEIYNLSGQSSVGVSFAEPASTFNSIVTSTIVMLEELRLNFPHVRFYNAGSSEMFGGVVGEPFTETSRFSPRSPYGAAKSSAYWVVSTYRESFGLFAVTGILFNHESPFRGPNFVTRKVVETAYAISRNQAGHLTLGDLSIWRDWGWAEDYVDAMFRMVQHDQPGDYVIATGEAMQLRDFVAYVFAYFDLDWKAYVQHSSALARPNELPYSCGDASKAREDLGWEPVYRGKSLIDKLCAEYTAILSLGDK